MRSCDRCPSPCAPASPSSRLAGRGRRGHALWSAAPAPGAALPDLTQDLGLADDRRIEAAGHGEEVLNRLAALQVIEVRLELPVRHAGVFAPEALELGPRAGGV